MPVHVKVESKLEQLVPAPVPPSKDGEKPAEPKSVSVVNVKFVPADAAVGQARALSDWKIQVPAKEAAAFQVGKEYAVDIKPV